MEFRKQSGMNGLVIAYEDDAYEVESVSKNLKADDFFGKIATINDTDYGMVVSAAAASSTTVTFGVAIGTSIVSFTYTNTTGAIVATV